MTPPDRLVPILDKKREDVARLKQQRPLAELERIVAGAPPTRGFRAALMRDGLQAIAEIKRRSPSAGALREAAEPAAIARLYERAGAAALSVLTEEHFFNGALADLHAARAAVALPVLRKDFVVDAYQLAETRAEGADAALLIVAALGRETSRLLEIGRGYGLDILVEVHNEAELEIALAAGADLVGVNNRDLTEFTIDLANSERLRPLIPAGIGTVAESGMETPADVARMARLPVDAVLIGSALMRAEDPGAALASLLGRSAAGPRVVA
jgi:indole-3-glycerol phosphate synthase